jgi:hypothetical protein
MKVWKKHQNNKLGYGIEVFSKNKVFVFHTSSKLNLLYWYLLFLFSKYIPKKNSLMFYSNLSGDKNYVI